MSSKAENRRFIAEELVRHSEVANDFRSELETLIRSYEPRLGVGPELESELVDIAKEEELGVVPDGSDTLQDDLPHGIGDKKALRWAARVHEGELSKDIALAAHTNVGTVQQSVDVAAAYIGLGVESGETGAD